MTRKKKNRVRPSRREAERQSHNPHPVIDDDDELEFEPVIKKQKMMQKQKQKQTSTIPPKQDSKHKAVNSSNGGKASSSLSSSSSSSSSSSTPSSPYSLYSSTCVNGLEIAEGVDESIKIQQDVEIDSRITASKFFEWLIYPVTKQSFFSDYWENKPLFISRSQLKAKGITTICTTQHTLVEMVPQQTEGEDGEQFDFTDENLQVESKKASSNNKHINKTAVKSNKELKTNENALPTEQVTVVEASWPSSSSSTSSGDHYYSGWFSIDEVHSLLRSPHHNIYYKRDIDITRYKNGKRETLNPKMERADESEVRKFIEEKDCSLRFLSPQKHSKQLHRLLNLLDNSLGMQSGINSYYTPAGTQGFAPHYDDVDILVMQNEGSKRWRLYPPRNKSEILPSISSRNFTQEEIGVPVMDVILRAGDFLYAPRGTIHQCMACAEESSLHSTLSTCLTSSWVDFFKLIMPRAIELAQEEFPNDFRKVLPLKWDKYMGVMNSDTPNQKKIILRNLFQDKFMKLVTKLIDLELLPFDAVADDLFNQLLNGRVPPVSSFGIKRRNIIVEKEEDEDEVEEEKTADQKKKKTQDEEEEESIPTFSQKNKNDILTTPPASSLSAVVLPNYTSTSLIRLVQDGVMRINTTPEGNTILVNHTTFNSKLFQKVPLRSIEYPVFYAQPIEFIINAYPKWLQFKDIPRPIEEEEEEEQGQQGDKNEDLIDLLNQFYEEGLIEVIPSGDKKLIESLHNKHLVKEVAAAEEEMEQEEEEDDPELDELLELQEGEAEEEEEATEEEGMYLDADEFPAEEADENVSEEQDEDEEPNDEDEDEDEEQDELEED